MKKRTLALAMAAIMGLTTACSGGGQTQQNAAAPAKETEKTGGVAAGGESGEAVTIKIANYALLEAGYDVTVVERDDAVGRDFEPGNQYGWRGRQNRLYFQ